MGLDQDEPREQDAEQITERDRIATDGDRQQHEQCKREHRHRPEPLTAQTHGRDQAPNDRNRRRAGWNIHGLRWRILSPRRGSGAGARRHRPD
jgi:hypothetical protein